MGAVPRECWGPEQKGFLPEVNGLLAFSVVWEGGSSKAWAGSALLTVRDHGLTIGHFFIFGIFNVP